MAEEYKRIEWNEGEKICCPSCLNNGGEKALTHRFTCELARHIYGKQACYQQNNKGELIKDYSMFDNCFVDMIDPYHLKVVCNVEKVEIVSLEKLKQGRMWK
jgi:hypothetical protein